MTRRLAAMASLALLASACADPDQFQSPFTPGGPAGVINGTVAYTGPLPCTEGGNIVGAALMLLFDTNLLPPPEGLGTSAASLAALGGNELFAGVADRLTFEPDGSRWCPPASAAPVNVSGDWAAGPLDAGVYEVRGFYDLDGNFDPSFGIANEPTKGDVAGGAIENAAAAAAGAHPVSRQIALGDLQADGTFVIPAVGARVGGVAVTLGLPLPLDRPVFHIEMVQDPVNAHPSLSAPKMASDFQLDTFSLTDLAGTQASFFALDLGAGVAPSEAATSMQSPFLLPANPTLTYSRYDVNGDGVIDGNDHIPQSTLLPGLQPIAVATKLEDGNLLAGQTAPSVVLQGITIFNDLLGTAGFGPTMTSTGDHVLVALPPAVLCIDTTDLTKHGVLVVSHKTDKHNNVILMDETGVTDAIAAQFHRPIDLVYACLPEGTYAMNLVYTTSQTWTLPNESGVCEPGETDGGTTCGSRAKLASQGATLTIGPPASAAYCTMNPVPAACAVAAN